MYLQVPPHTCVGPLSSTHELQDAKKDNINFNTKLFLSPPLLIKLVLGWPLLLLVKVLSSTPSYALMFLMETQPWSVVRSRLNASTHSLLFSLL